MNVGESSAFILECIFSFFIFPGRIVVFTVVITIVLIITADLGDALLGPGVTEQYLRL